MKKRVADIIVERLIYHGITDCFSVVGGGAMHLNNAFEIHDEIKKIYCHHEQACAMAAEGYAKAKGKLAAVCVTSGPGGLNALNGVQGAYVDSVPMIVISGYPRYETTVSSSGLNLRCRGVQENDIVYMVQKITKYAKLIVEPRDIIYEIDKAIKLSMEGRRGPVWLDIPLNVQGSFVETETLKKYTKESKTEKELDISMLNEFLTRSERPCILTGSAIRTSDVRDEFLKFSDFLQIPIVGGALQADVTFNEQPRFFGMSGSMGPRGGNFILQNADLILVLGNSLSFKQTGFAQEKFASKAKIVMVDTDSDEAKKPGLHVDLLIHSDLKTFFASYNDKGVRMKASEKWFAYCRDVKQAFPPFEMLERAGEIPETERIPVLLFWKRFLSVAPDNAVIALGNSSCVHGVLQEGINKRTQRVIVNYNSGSMGDDIPEAIGMAEALNQEVFLVTGDGSFMMNMQELQTMVHHKYPIKIILFSNMGYGAIRTTCKNFFNGIYTGCDEKSGVSFPSFEKVAEAFDIPYYECSNIKSLDKGINWLLDNKGYCMLEIHQMIDDIKGPKLESKMLGDGSFVTPALHDMSPFLLKEELDRLMWKE